MDQSGGFERDFSAGATGNRALLIDGENVASCHAPTILGRKPELFSVRKVYGNFATLQERRWTDVPELRVVHACRGNDSADILLAIEAIVLLRSGVRNFVIVTGDGGLIHLVDHLRAEGCHVAVMAPKVCSRALRTAGHSFVELVEPDEGTSGQKHKGESPAPLVGMPAKDFDQFVLQEVRKAGQEGLAISALNAAVMANYAAGIGSRPQKTWRAYFKQDERTKLFVYRANGPNASVVMAEFHPPSPTP